MIEESKNTSVIVLGAGIVGVCVALHLQARGRDVVLIDRERPGSQTSHGNAGLIERASVIPYAMPLDLSSLFAFAFNRTVAVRYRPLALFKLLPWLLRYWWYSGAKRLKVVAQEMLPLIERSVSEHLKLAAAAGTESLMRDGGWIELYRSASAFRNAVRASGELGRYGLSFDVLTAQELKAREPSLSGQLAGAIHWHDPMTVTDPSAVTQAYARLFEDRGGTLSVGDGNTLAQDQDEWTVMAAGVRYRAAQVVVAMGPWSSDLYKRFGYDFPIAYKRGYHMHYGVDGERSLQVPVCDVEAGLVLSPMTRGIRLTTGVELAERDAPSDVRQLAAAEAIARQYFPLGTAMDPTPWRGARPCLPDMKPIIGAAKHHAGMWFALGHAYHGFTLGPVTGRLLAEMMTGEDPFTNPVPYSPDRFGR